MDADGDFVVTWTSAYTGGGLQRIFAQRYDAAGKRRGSEFLVSGFGSEISRSAVAMGSTGEFIVVWHDYQTGTGGSVDILAQRYNAAGEPTGSQITIATNGTPMEPHTAVTMDADGDFVAAWAGHGSDGRYVIFRRRYTAAGNPEGVEFQPGPSSYGPPVVAMDADGDFVVAWQSYGQYGDGWSVFAQRFDGAERVEGDFDGDGKADLLWRNTATGQTVRSPAPATSTATARRTFSGATAPPATPSSGR
jgi:hypothetical protein